MPDETASNANLWGNRLADGSTEIPWPMWMTSEQADRIAETLQRLGFTNVQLKDDDKVLRVTATDPDKGDSYTVRVGTPTELWMIEGRFKSWRPKRV